MYCIGDSTGIYTYIDSDSNRVLQVSFQQSLWSSNPQWSADGYTNPYTAGNGATSASPFDQPFYIVMSVAAGGINGYVHFNSSQSLSIQTILALYNSTRYVN